MQDKYMAYVGSYSYNGQAKGITVYDVDEKKGKFIYRCEVEVDNSSYLTVSHDGGCSIPSRTRALWRSEFWKMAHSAV